MEFSFFFTFPLYFDISLILRDFGRDGEAGWVAKIEISENRTQISSTQPMNPAGVVWRKCRVRWSVWGPGSFFTFWWFSGAGRIGFGSKIVRHLEIERYSYHRFLLCFCNGHAPGVPVLRSRFRDCFATHRFSYHSGELALVRKVETGMEGCKPA